MASSSTSLRIVRIDATINFDWNAITSATLPRLQELHLTGRNIPSLISLLSGCASLKELSLDRYNEDPTIALSDSTNQLSQLSKELASLPDPTLKRCGLLFHYVGRSRGVITLQEVEDLIELPSLANLENLDLYGKKKDWDEAEVETMRAIKGKKGKLVVEVTLL